MSLRRSVIRSVNSSATSQGTIEDIALINHTQIVSVILVNSNRRITGLQVVGGRVSIGDSVTIDFSSGGHPYVRPNTPEEEEASIAYEKVAEITEDSEPKDNIPFDWELELQKLLQEAPKCFGIKVVDGVAVFNSIGASYSGGTIYTPIPGIYWVQVTATVSEGTPGGAVVQMIDMIDDKNSDDTVYDIYYPDPDSGLIGGDNIFSMSSVVYSEKSDMIIGGVGSGFWVKVPCSDVANEITAILLVPSSQLYIGYNDWRVW
jgi:hypothetical protein